jgi:2-dehydro-3-deoxyphosphogluconate aldolase/(4S)-4-hydroxy-2-oxoglutarate aldolase
VFTVAAVAVTVAVWALWEGWRPESPMPEERSVVDEPIVHIPKAGLILWVTVRSDEDVVPIVDALHRGGVTTVALQATTSALPQAVGRARAAFARRVLIGAAGVRTAEETRDAVRAGAEFVLTTGADPEVIQACQDARALAIPGAFTPTEIGQAWNLRTGLVALFPAGRVGPGYVRDVLRSMPDITAVATGGVTPENAGEFIRAGAAAVVAIEEPDAGEARDYDAMTRHARALVDTIERARARPARPTPPVRPIEGPDIR